MDQFPEKNTICWLLVVTAKLIKLEPLAAEMTKWRSWSIWGI